MSLKCICHLKRTQTFILFSKYLKTLSTIKYSCSNLQHKRFNLFPFSFDAIYIYTINKKWKKNILFQPELLAQPILN